MGKLVISASKKAAIDTNKWYNEASKLSDQQQTGTPKSDMGVRPEKSRSAHVNIS
jgi:hypothetical protein